MRRSALLIACTNLAGLPLRAPLAAAASLLSVRRSAPDASGLSASSSPRVHDRPRRWRRRRFVAAAAVPLLTRLVPISLPIGDASAFDARVLAFSLGLSLVTALAFGVAPAWRLCRAPDMNDSRGEARSSAAKRGQRARAALVVAQVAASVVLLVAAALLLRRCGAQQADPGSHDNVLAVQTPLAWPRMH